MATRRGPGEPVDPFNALPLGQTLSGERERTRDEARRALDASLGRSRVDVLSERAQTVLSEIRETPDEAQRSADLAAMQRRLAADAEEARQRSLRDAAQRARQQVEAEQARRSREIAEARARQEEIRRRALRARQAEENHHVEQVRRDDAAFERDMAERRERALVDSPDAHTLRIIEQRLQRKVEAVQRALIALTEDLADVQQTLAKKAPAPTGNEDAPFCEGERHLDLGEDQ